jgi:DNA polymerase I
MARGGARAHTNVDRVVAPARPVEATRFTDGGLFAALGTPLFCVDGNNLLWRAAHGSPAPFAADDGRDLTPLFRFITKLRRAVGTYGVFAECVVCFDGADAWSGRLDVDASYKANRSYENADLSFMGWLPEIRAALDCVGIANVEIADSEADDVIATLTVRAAGRPVRIYSTDRDYYQLVSDTTMVVGPRTGLIDERHIIDRYGVTPAQWCDFRALAGDPSDGIPGLPGVGMTRAAAMLAGGKTIEDLRDDPAVTMHWDDLARWRELIRVRTDVPVGIELSGSATPRLPSPSAICAALGLVG